MRSPGRFLLFVVLVIVGVKLSEQAYALVAFRDERVQARELRTQLLSAGAELVDARLEADSLRRVIAAEDERLERELRVVQRFHRQARRGPMTAEDFAAYGQKLERYNLNVVSRNAVLRRLEALHQRQHAAVTRYNLLADSLHALAVKMGQPYYQVPTALEAAAEARERERDGVME
ncbi:MAG: hypothetical protein KY467_13555 [Gemmatimonadetes bacterium]|nr:hypothetical protein [Gemmatimonadota bacterium]